MFFWIAAIALALLCIHAVGFLRGAQLAGNFEWYVATRIMRGTHHAWVHTTSKVAVLGVALGVMALVSVTAVMSGYEDEVEQRLLSTNAHVIVQKYDIAFREYNDVASKIRARAGVFAVSAFVFHEGIVSHGDDAATILIKGVDAGEASSVTHLEQNICMSNRATCEHEPNTQKARVLLQDMFRFESMDPINPNDASREDAGALPVILGDALAARVRAHVGDIVLITTPVGEDTTSSQLPKRQAFRVSGLFHAGMYEFDSRLVYMPLQAAQIFLNMPHAVSGLEVRLQNILQLEKVKKDILSVVGYYPFNVMDYRALNAGIFNAIGMQKIVMFLVLLGMVVVAAFNIASTLFMVVLEKSRDIALLKALGASDAALRHVFVLQGWVLGGVGALLGVCLGLLVAFALSQWHLPIAADVYMIDTMHVRIDLYDIASTVLATCVVAHLASLYPAFLAARKKPVDGLRDGLDNAI